MTTNTEALVAEDYARRIHEIVNYPDSVLAIRHMRDLRSCAQFIEQQATRLRELEAKLNDRWKWEQKVAEMRADLDSITDGRYTPTAQERDRLREALEAIATLDAGSDRYTYVCDMAREALREEETNE